MPQPGIQQVLCQKKVQLYLFNDFSILRGTSRVRRFAAPASRRLIDASGPRFSIFAAVYPIRDFPFLSCQLPVSFLPDADAPPRREIHLVAFLDAESGVETLLIDHGRGTAHGGRRVRIGLDVLNRVGLAHLAAPYL